MPEDLSQLSDQDLLSSAITRSGLSVRHFAVQELTRDERTVRRWLAGDQPLAKEVRRHLERGRPSVAELVVVLHELVDADDQELAGAREKGRRMLELMSSGESSG